LLSTHKELTRILPRIEILGCPNEELDSVVLIVIPRLVHVHLNPAHFLGKFKLEPFLVFMELESDLDLSLFPTVHDRGMEALEHVLHGFLDLFLVSASHELDAEEGAERGVVMTGVLDEFLEEGQKVFRGQGVGNIEDKGAETEDVQKLV